MKKYKRVTAILFAVSLAFSTAQIYAESEEDTGDTTQYYTLSDGTVIAYSNTAMNGGIDWEGIQNEEQSVEDDTQYYTLQDGHVIAYSNKAMDGGIVLPDSDDEEAPEISIPESVVITVPFQTQQKSYYSGPAAAKMVLGAIGCDRTQDELATLLHTVPGEGTPAGENVANALNSVCKGTGYRFTWEWHEPRDYETIRGHIIEALNYGNPVMVNVLEGPGDSYLQGHECSSGYIGRYGVVADYFDYGNEVTYTDPGAGMFEGFTVDQRITLEDLSKACGGRGYAW